MTPHLTLPMPAPQGHSSPKFGEINMSTIGHIVGFPYLLVLTKPSCVVLQLQYRRFKSSISQLHADG